ncbi:hypothetical protein RQP46_009819 [Phenoliferia psychrophenolica]
MFKPKKPAPNKTPPSPKTLDDKIAELEKELATADDTAAMGLYRGFSDWATANVDNAVDIITLIPPAAPFAPVVKLVLAVFVLLADGNDASDALGGLNSKLVEIHRAILPLRAHIQALKPIIDGIESILGGVHLYVTEHFKKRTWKLIKGAKKSHVPALARIEIKVEGVAAQQLVTHAAVLQTDAHVVEGIQTILGTLGTNAPPPVLSKLEGLPFNLELIGREHDLERTLALLARRNRQGFTEHVALVGPGGIGKTTLATKVAYHPSMQASGRTVFLRCENLATLAAFQTELLKLRAPKALQPGENLEEAVRSELERATLFLILDNLLDSTDATTHATYLEYIDSLTSIPSLTLLITSRNHTFIGRNTPRKIRGITLEGLPYDKAEELFRATYEDGAGDSDRQLELNEPHMPELLRMLDGMPLAIVLVAAHARTVDSLEEVVRRWKEGRASDNGAESRTTSVDFSLKLSLTDPIINNPTTLTFLRLLAELPEPVLRSRDRAIFWYRLDGGDTLGLSFDDTFKLAEAVEQAKLHGLERLKAEILCRLAETLQEHPADYVKAWEAYEEVS